MREGFVSRAGGALVLALLLVAAFFLVGVPGATASHGAGIAPGTAVIDGAYSEWEIPHDFFADLLLAGGQGGQTEVLGQAYLRYDCDSGTLFVLTLAEEGVVVDESTDDAWVKIDEFGTGNSPDQTQFEWVLDGGDAIGFEAAVDDLPADAYTIEIHQNVDSGDTTSTGKLGIGLILECEPTEPTTPPTEPTTPPTEPTTPPTEPTTPPTEPTTPELEVSETTDVSVLAVQITTTTVTVSPETLPFTGAGFGEGGAVGIALAMLALGGTALLAVRRREEDAVTVATGWSSRLWDVE